MPHESVRINRRHENVAVSTIICYPAYLSSSRQQARHRCCRTRSVPPAYSAGGEIKRRRPHQFSAYSIQQNDAKGFVEFVLQRAGFCEYIIVFETLCYKLQYAFLLVTKLFDTDVCVKALKGNSLKGENVGFFW